MAKHKEKILKTIKILRCEFKRENKKKKTPLIQVFTNPGFSYNEPKIIIKKNKARWTQFRVNSAT